MVITALDRPNTPTPSGYITAAAIAWGVGSLLTSVFAVSNGGGWDVASYLASAGVVAGVSLVALAFLGAPLAAATHFLIRGKRSQVLAIGAVAGVGFVLGAITMSTIFNGLFGAVAPWLIVASTTFAAG